MSNPFAVVEKKEAELSVMSNTDEARAVQEVQASLVIAKRFPRNQREAYDRVIMACTRPGLANSGLYSYSRGGQEVTGPSIRLAEALAQTWGNMTFGARELSSTAEYSVMEVFAWDLETNTRQSKVFTVKHERHSKSGAKKLTDPRDMYENVANNASRRLRACILGVIPGDVIEAAVTQCEETMKAAVDTSPDKIKILLQTFEAIGVSKAQIEKKIQCRLDAIRPAQVVNLRKIYRSIADGMSDIADWFEISAEISPATLKAAAEAAAGQVPEPPPVAPEPPADRAPEPPNQQPPTQQPPRPRPTL